MTRRYTIPALIAAALVVAMGAYALSRPAEAPEASGEAVATAVEPTASNVDPGIHAEMMRLKATAEASPEDVDAQLAFAQMALGAHRGADAAEALERAVALTPEARQPWLDLAQAYGVAEDWDAVVDASERMLARFPGDASAQYNVGAAHANAGRVAEAQTAWRAVAAQTTDAPLAEQARASLTQLAAMAASPEATSAPPLADGQTALPAGHPPIGGAAASGARGGVETRVVEGGSADVRALRTLITERASVE